MRIRHDISDLSTLEVLDTSTVLNSLKSRFQEGLYYTYIGDILVAINPCQPVNLYEAHNHERYKNLYERRRETPHIYWVADELYRNLRDSGDDQCVIVSGESGAGKTESIKHILNHVIRLGPNNVGDLVQQLDQVNPLLELFGNATTPLNKNSSRFCKFIELQYVADGQLQNGQIQFFILEKSRLIQRHQNEKNFHIFYALLGGLDPGIKSQFSLGDVADYRILVGEDEAAPVFNNQEDYREFINKFEALEIALQKIGFKDEEIENIYSVLSAILNLTNITFEYSEDQTKLDFIDPSQIECVAHLLSIDNVESLESSLLFTKLSVDDIKKPKTLAEANESRDALGKELYHRLFSCIIDKINSKLRESVTNSPTLQTKKLPTINLLDISGFENLNVNGFEQLLINTANEVLHQIFLKHVMKSEQEEYEKEGVEWKEISFTDNTDVIDLITKCHKESTTSIFHILEDEASISPGTDLTLVRKLNKNFSENQYYRAKTETDLLFGIVHYADTVMYSAVGFREKTKDTLSRCLKNVIQESKNPLLIRYSSIGNSGKIGVQRDSFRTKDAGIKRNESVTKQFRTSLRQLQTKLNQSNLMFVRCLKPNAHLKPNKFDNRCMSAQLKACGLAEAASIRKEGYPVRMTFTAFANRYENISEPNFNFTDSHEKCVHIINVSGIHKYHIGKTKVLLNYKEKEVLERLKKQREKIISIPPSGRSSFSSNCRIQDLGRNSNRISKANTHRSMINLEVPQSVFLPEKEEISENKESPFEEMDESKIPAYDAFRETERDIDEDNDFFTKLLKVFRFLFYIFTICGILISAVSNRMGLLLLAGSDKPTEKAKLFISLGIPMVFSWGSNAMKCAFRGKVKPSWKSYIFIVMSFFVCNKEWIPKDTFTVTFRCCKLDFPNELLTPVIIIAIIWLTTMVIVAHIWYPESERMALFSKLFVPQFDPLLLDLSLLLRRRQDHKENKENKENKVKVDKESPNEKSRPKLLVCATTWHETRQEMVQLLKSLFRLDKQQIVAKISKQIAAKNEWEKKENDGYDLEIHIIFDDAWEIDEVSKQEIPNGFVKEFVSLIPEAVMSVAKGHVPLGPIKKVTTPYGGRLEIKMPGTTPMIIHLKNKDKIRHRKRWSQVMYLYYLLGFKTFGDKKSVEDLIPKNQSKSSKVRSNVSILNHLPTEEYKKIENTFLLTLDGDVDFKPDSVKLLIDRMLKNKKVGAVCGRIHPIGSGPMIWYQQFEYAVGHWLQKAAEHVFGCVLCCPGCFSLFRASAVMDDNVMRAYTKKPIVARDFIQYEQGEDRWLCTLLLQQGYKIDYCAGADAYTFAPENFHDFYIQRPIRLYVFMFLSLPLVGKSLILKRDIN
ncbi:Chitin synthase chs-1,Chitin synthase chs-2,Chitin synthase [Acanthosepion pharaonis]|uniref:chitin synthase n=1 Tax=Acanthosepion pharaonis TaxID=158019 RepID=A0A812AMM7_ACAPH|nr:Chitin synthase chs-1,Chitin synthase chs-2,Chitin synthase [Sepia pharaonis]